VFAAKLGANNILVTIVETQIVGDSPEKNPEIISASLKSFNALLNKQPDLFDAESLSLVIKLIQEFKENTQILSLTLQWLAKSCIMHENNRQNIIGADIMTYLKPLVGIKNDVIIRDLCACFRVEFGKAHEHARIIASSVLVELTQLLPEYEDPLLLSDMILTIASLAVRQELCVAVEDANGLEYVFDVMKKHPDHPKLNKEALKLLRALAGNDTTKVHIVQKGAAPIVQNILVIHKENEQVAGTALACISTLTLRVKDNSTAFFETGVAENIADVMTLHPKSKVVQRNAAWAIRNMVSRSRDQCDSFLSHGVEDLLNQAMKDHPSVIQDVKAALRDLGCKVHLKEEWTGTAEKAKIISNPYRGSYQKSYARKQIDDESDVRFLHSEQYSNAGM
uniref:Armadillo repeat-containing protein 8 n=1 Tax=Megaselia scalaris TaxID=36166 RepID=T1GDR3_MEGSC